MPPDPSMPVAVRENLSLLVRRDPTMAFDAGCRVRIEGLELWTVCELEVAELEAGCHGASNQTVRRTGDQLGAEPRPGRNNDLRPIAGLEMQTEPRHVPRAACEQPQ